jgi:fermentation-respiration switch protein FrsA (DUF1100 family)
VGQQDAAIPFSNAADYLKALRHATLVPLRHFLAERPTN